jgi:hypothetical protein
MSVMNTVEGAYIAHANDADHRLLALPAIGLLGAHVEAIVGC